MQSKIEKYEVFTLPLLHKGFSHHQIFTYIPTSLSTKSIEFIAGAVHSTELNKCAVTISYRTVSLL
jgi:hypothetical protein